MLRDWEATAVIAVFVSKMIFATALTQFRLGTPDIIEMIYEATGSPQSGFRIRADYQWPDKFSGSKFWPAVDCWRCGRRPS